MKKTESFGFVIEPQYSFSEGQKTAIKNRYSVYLPHSCDEWQIAYGNKAACVRDLEAFIKEALETLEKLKQL